MLGVARNNGTMTVQDAASSFSKTGPFADSAPTRDAQPSHLGSGSDNVIMRTSIPYSFQMVLALGCGWHATSRSIGLSIFAAFAYQNLNPCLSQADVATLPSSSGSWLSLPALPFASCFACGAVLSRSSIAIQFTWCKIYSFLSTWPNRRLRRRWCCHRPES